MNYLNNDLLGAALLLLLFVSLIAGVEFWTRLREPDPELSRKCVHIGGGLGCLLFPFFVGSPWVVAALAGIFTAIFWAGARWRLLRCLNQVGRVSRGSEYFPLAVSGLFYIARGRWWLYLSAILILTLADAAAALIGGRFGRTRFQVGPDDEKSLEGSLTFWVITFLVLLGLLSFLTDLPVLSCLATAYLVAALLTGIEAISIKGTDNLFVPILTCYVLLKITTKPPREVVIQCLSLTLIMVGVILVNRLGRIFSVRDTILFTCFSYAAWSLGSADWALPIFLAYLFYCSVRWILGRPPEDQASTASLLRLIIVPFALLIVANASGLYEELYGPFLLAVMLSGFHATRLGWLTADGPGREWRRDALPAVLATLLIGTGPALRQTSVPWTGLAIMIGLAVLLGALSGNPAKRDDQGVGGRWPLPFWLTSLAGAGLYFFLQSGGLVWAWHPQY